MPTLDKAIELAARSHAGVLDKQGLPYILHPLRVMLGVNDPVAQIVAVLHDVVEDTDVSLDDIRAEGFSDSVLAALDLVTHAAGVPYTEYVIRCKANPIAQQVKISDLMDNASLSRVLLREERMEDDGRRVQKYLFSYRFLTDQIDETSYRRVMSQLEAST